VLLDCGMFQGRRSETRAKNAALPLGVREIDAVVLSHAHHGQPVCCHHPAHRAFAIAARKDQR
jgi:Cft2 family RNA processing exonuclease